MVIHSVYVCNSVEREEKERIEREKREQEQREYQERVKKLEELEKKKRQREMEIEERERRREEERRGLDDPFSRKVGNTCRFVFFLTASSSVDCLEEDGSIAKS